MLVHQRVSTPNIMLVVWLCIKIGYEYLQTLWFITICPIKIAI